MKYFTYIFRNARRNPIRSLLTIASTGISLFLMMILLAFFDMREDAAKANRVFNRIITMNATGFAGMVPIGRVPEVSRMEGVLATSPFGWFGGKYHDETMPFGQFSVDADSVFKVLDEFHVSDSQLADFKANKDGAAIGRRLANDRGLKIGDRLPLKGDMYPVDMDLTVRAIYDGPTNRNLRMCLFHYEYLDEALKKVTMSSASGGSLVHQQRPELGQRRHDLHQVQERRRHALAGQENRRSLSQQRVSDPHANRGSVRQDVRGHAG